MAEYIERNKIFSVWRSMPAPASVTSLAEAIHQTPAIEIVRCRDCKHYHAYGPGVLTGVAVWGKCKLISMDVDMPVNGYCCFGEEKDHE